MTAYARGSPEVMDATAEDTPARGSLTYVARRVERLSPTYGRFVTFMKLLLPTVATALVVLVLVWPQLAEQDRRFRIGVARIDKDAAENLSMINARYTGVDERRRPFAVTADAARQTGSDSPVVLLTQPKADIVLENGSWVALTAESGVYNRNTQILELTGAVNLFHDKGYEFRTTSAVFDLGAGDAIGTEPVEGQGPFGHIAAEGFVIRNRGERIEFTGRSRVVLYANPLKTETKAEGTR